MSISILSALILAFSFQAGKVSSNFSDGLTYVMTIAEKNTGSKDPESIAEAACSDKFMSIVNRESCLKEYVDSLTAGHWRVIRRYFYFPHFLPWIDNLLPYPNHNRILEIRLGWSSVYAFRLLLILTGIMVVKKRKSLPWCLLIMLSFISPISWYFFAKGHSFIHGHLNFVLWYLPFVPFSILFFIESILKSPTNTATTEEGVSP